MPLPFGILILFAANSISSPIFRLFPPRIVLRPPATDASDCSVLKWRWLVRRARALSLLEVRGLGPLCTTGGISRRGFYSTAYSTLHTFHLTRSTGYFARIYLVILHLHITIHIHRGLHATLLTA